MENTIKKSWRDISINEYYQLKDISDDTEMEEYEKEVALIAFLNNMTESEVWNLDINKFRKLQVEKTWLYEFNFDKSKNFKKIEIKGNKYNVNIDLQKMNVAQYIDFQTYWPQRDNMRQIIGNLLAIFIIPKGHKYNEGYDIDEVISDIKENIDIMTAQEILFFFLSSYQISIRIMLNYLNWKMKRLKKKSNPKKKEIIENIQKEIQNLEKLILDGSI